MKIGQRENEKNGQKLSREPLKCDLEVCTIGLIQDVSTLNGHLKSRL